MGDATNDAVIHLVALIGDAKKETKWQKITLLFLKSSPRRACNIKRYQKRLTGLESYKQV
ncbi:MAG: hypothetical protein ACXV5N_09600 [Halobacteriota archaeon]